MKTKIHKAKVKILSNERGKCPYCNSLNVEYESITLSADHLDDDMFYYPAYCEDCGRDFEEWYSMTFVSHKVGDLCNSNACGLVGKEIEMTKD